MTPNTARYTAKKMCQKTHKFNFHAAVKEMQKQVTQNSFEIG